MLHYKPIKLIIDVECLTTVIMKKRDATIVVPAFNEEGSIQLLTERLDAAMKKAGKTYSLVIVDDRSTDKTAEIVKDLSKKYPITVLQKKLNTQRGKASSLLAGFSYADNSEVIAMIDADLQYPPEDIPEMLQKIDQGADVVVARRKKRKIGVVRDTASFVFRYVFGNMLLGLPYDVQSGLKVFKREVVERMNLQPTQWMFDLEFLLLARDAGYSIVSHDITFHKRVSGQAKISVISAAIEMASSAIKLKFRDTPSIPFAKKHIEHGEGFHYKGAPYVNYTELEHHETALKQVTNVQLLFIIWLVSLLVICLVLNWQLTLTILVGLMTILYFTDLLFNAYLVYRSFSGQREITIPHTEIASHADDFWPKYTIFCPLYKEWQVLPQFIRAMSQLDYPKNKLQVMLLLEEDDTESVEHISSMKLPSFFTVKVIPHSKPKTKPKALNFGLKYATGEYAVIYDAEDIPDPQQLKKTVLAFAHSDRSVVCIQAKLNFYNPTQNMLTRIFTAEYSLWFDLVLPGLQSIGAPIPLGGTSNHFRVADLIKLKGWDAFNVTEDCDLGMRLAKNGFKTAIVDSTTMEEANSRYFNWYGQRSRWIKGYIQTYLVHTRDLSKFTKSSNKHDAITFQLIVGGKILSMFINPFMWLITFSYFAFRATLGPVIESFFPTPILYMGVICLVAGNFLYMYYYMIGCVKRGYFNLIKFALITPIYWLFMSLASWRAVFEIMFKPHYWSKTVHGFHLAKKKVKTKEKSGTFNHVLSEYTPRMKNPQTESLLPEYCNILSV